MVYLRGMSAALEGPMLRAELAGCARQLALAVLGSTGGKGNSVSVCVCVCARARARSCVVTSFTCYSGHAPAAFAAYLAGHLVIGRWGLRLNAEKQCMEVDPMEMGPGVHWLTAVEGGAEGAERLEILLREYGPLWQAADLSPIALEAEAWEYKPPPLGRLPPGLMFLDQQLHVHTAALSCQECKSNIG
eukprot:1153119-Pelagomonas_calceolata.AAC.19